MERKTAATPLNQFSSANQPDVATQVPAFTPVLSGFVDLLNKLPAARYVPIGTLLIEQGRTSQTVHLVQSGLVKLVHLNAHGRETTIGLRSEGWYAGSTSVLLHAPSIYSVRAVTACMVTRIPATDFSLCLRQNPEVLDHFLSGLCFEVASQASLQVEVMSSSAADRLDHFLMERKSNHPSRKVLDPMPLLKQMELAQLLSITPEHLSRLIHKKRDASLRAVAGRARSIVKEDQGPAL